MFEEQCADVKNENLFYNTRKAESSAEGPINVKLVIDQSAAGTSEK